MTLQLGSCDPYAMFSLSFLFSHWTFPIILFENTKINGYVNETEKKISMLMQSDDGLLPFSESFFFPFRNTIQACKTVHTISRCYTFHCFVGILEPSITYNEYKNLPLSENTVSKSDYGLLSTGWFLDT